MDGATRFFEGLILMHSAHDASPEHLPPVAHGELPVASAAEIHAHLVKANAIGNAARLRFAMLLLAVSESRLYFELGHPGVVQYAEQAFKMGRTETLETLRVAKLMPERPELRAACERGEITWSLLKMLTRVATEESEGEWLTFARKHTVAQIHIEVRDAPFDKLRAGRRKSATTPEPTATGCRTSRRTGAWTFPARNEPDSMFPLASS